MFFSTLQARRGALAAAIVALALCTETHAQNSNATCNSPPAPATILNEIHTIADASQAVPLECSFSVSVAGTYQVTLTDLGVVTGSNPATPAPLASVKLAVTNGSTIVGTPLTSAGSMQFSASVGTYIIRVVGRPSSTPGSGPVGISVTNVADSSTLASFSQNLALPNSELPNGEAVIDDSFTVPSDGSYVVTLTDLQLPQALPTLLLLITTEDGTFVTSPPLSAAGSTTVPLTHGVTYRIFAVGQADPAVNAGLFSASVAPAGGGPPAYNKAVPIGVSALGSADLTSGTSYTFSLKDLSYPSALSALGGVVIGNGQVVAQLTTAGSSAPFTAAAGTNYQVYALGSTSSTGSFGATVAASSGPAAFSVARAVTASGGGVSAYSYDTAFTSAGSYQFDLADFAAPTKLSPINAVVVQNGATLGTPLTGTGNENVNAAVGAASVLVFVQADTTGGLFGADLTQSGAAPLFQTTQGVGQLFSSRQISITAAGDYALSVADVGFPSPLASFAVYLTQGVNRVGSVYSGGPIKFTAAPGTYNVSFIAQPGGTDKAGTYSIAIAPAPVVTFSSSATSVTKGGTVTLTWSSTNATSCTASGGWTGTQATSGTVTSSALNTSTTFTLTCSGAGLNVAQSVNVAVADPPAKSGGGAIDRDLLLALTLAMGLRLLTCAGRSRV
jgi:hypothetical protein